MKTIIFGIMFLTSPVLADDWRLQVVYPDNEIKEYLLDENSKDFFSVNLPDSAMVSCNVTSTDKSKGDGLKFAKRSIVCAPIVLGNKSNPHLFSTSVVCLPKSENFRAMSGSLKIFDPSGKIYTLNVSCKYP